MTALDTPNLGMRLWLEKEPLLLASTSITRRTLLESAGLDIEPCASDVDERSVEEGLLGASPSERARSLATCKTMAVAGRRQNRVVVGADQILSLDGEVFHKPVDAEAAMAQLACLSGRTHELHSAVTLVNRDGVSVSFVKTARLTMRHLDSRAIASYVALAGHDRVTSSVGGYQFEGLGVHLFASVEGDHSTILGLPLIPLLDRLRVWGHLAF